ncbi:MAG TPA: 3-dehydro-L-gulonate 2-dehydrogenase [Candidatus Angelobacter sp.]|jgi:3-dehydro-L-gulonate 2-dehydrogenase|nr:3-dehydro-L-gulonate 2-dehydrogenase [Candidatus Angelobacter sp.]
MIRVSYSEVFETLSHILLNRGFTAERASLCARLITDSSRDGVNSHGVERFPRFIRGIQKGLVDIHAIPKLLMANGPLERWDGQRGPGNVNAHQCMDRAIELCRKHGMGCVALGNTNHWMRGGSYGWQAAEAGVIGICWTNTMPNLPPWGASDPRVGNNPLVIAVPRAQGHVVLDIAMSQFSYGALASYRMRGEMLPLDGGFDSQGKLTRDPGAIEASARPLPIGYWKGSGLALMLDLVATMLSGGFATYQITADPELESNLSQVFITFDASRLNYGDASEQVDRIIEHLQSSSGTGEQVRYPGERVLNIREENMVKGIPLNEKVWNEVKNLAAIY